MPLRLRLKLELGEISPVAQRIAESLIAPRQMLRLTVNVGLAVSVRGFQREERVDLCGRAEATRSAPGPTMERPDETLLGEIGMRELRSISFRRSHS